jgi:hypothetical protein
MRSLAGQVNGLDSVPQPTAGLRYDWPAVTNAALATIATALFTTASEPSRTAIERLEQQFQSGEESRVEAEVRARSRAHGAALGEAIAAWAAADGIGDQGNCAWTPPTTPGSWVPTPPGLRPPLQPCWGSLRPFALGAGGECHPLPHPDYSTNHGSEFHEEADEVYRAVNEATEEQARIALYWADDPGVTGTPPGHWIAIVGRFLQQNRSSLDVAAEAYARVGIAVADSFISCWEAKYKFSLLRPVTYIQAHIDPVWLPPITTPPFPEYTSGHSVQSAAAAEVLTDLFGNVPFVDSTHVDRGFPSRSYASFFEAANEAAISRLYGGIHYRAACEEGLAQGLCVGRSILGRVRFRR